MEARALFDALGVMALIHHEELAGEKGELWDEVTRLDWEEMMLLDAEEEQEKEGGNQ